MNPAPRLVLALLALPPFACGALAQVRDPLPVPDLPGYKTLKGDFHLHTVFSDGEVWPTVRVLEAWRDGLDVIAITDHAEYHPHEADVRVDGSRSYEIARPLAERLGLLLVPAVEITKNFTRGSGHFNALFVTDANALRVGDMRDLSGLKEALRRARAQDAFVFWNHPRFHVDVGEWFPPVAEAFEEKLFRGMELVNGPDFYAEAYPWVEEKGLTILCNSDAHLPMEPRQVSGKLRPITLVFARTRDLAGVREAFLARRTAAWMGDHLWGAEEHLRGLWEGAALVENREITARPGSAPLLRVRNTSAIPFHLRTVKTPDWLSGLAGELTPQTISAFRLEIGREAPAGLSRVELELEITNLHAGPGRQLRVPLPLSIQVVRP